VIDQIKGYTMVHATMNVALFFPTGAQHSVTDDDWSIKLIDLFTSEDEASGHVTQCIDDEPQGTMFMIHPVGTWLACTANSAWYQNLNELSSKEHNNPTIGRHGSVCDIRSPHTTEAPNLPPPTRTEKETVHTSHHARLQQLLDYKDTTLCNTDQYTSLLDQYAMLGAYVRGLQKHIDTADESIKNTEKAIWDLEAEFPDYRAECVTRYTTALAESGITMDDSDETSVLHHLMRGC
jgi:hypothetical protein